MPAFPYFRQILASFFTLFALFATSIAADESSRIAFDMGSSGIRAGASNSVLTTRAEIDYLGPQWAGRGLEETVAPTIAALHDLPEQGGFAPACVRVGGGFSAWRLALQQNPDELARTLARLQAASGVAVLVIPQLQEGAYGYFGVCQLLGGQLTTSHILDIGGASLQVVGERCPAWASRPTPATRRLAPGQATEFPTGLGKPQPGANLGVDPGIGQ